MINKQYRYHKKVFCFIFSCMIFISAVFAGKKGNDSYQFPVRPGMDTWKTFTTYQQMLDACMIPSPFLTGMSTEALILTCMDYPCKGWMSNYESYQSGIEGQVIGFNGLRELLQRADAGTKLIEYYRTLQPDVYNRRWSDFERHMHRYDITYVEMVLQRNELLSTLTAAQQKDLLALCLEKAQKRSYKNEYDDTRYHVGWALLAGKLMAKQNHKPHMRNVSANEYSSFIEYGNINCITNNLLNDILRNGRAVLNPAVFKQKFTPLDFIPQLRPNKDSTILTPKGSTMKINVRDTETQSVSQMKTWFQGNLQDFPNAIPLEPYATQKYGTSKFNCHAYGLFFEDSLPKICAWVWPTNNGPTVLVTDGSLQPRQDTTSAGNGTRVVLWDGANGTGQMLHSFTVVPKRGKQGASKWGNNAVYAHDMLYHPYNTCKSMKYYDYPNVKYGAYDLQPQKIKETADNIHFARHVRILNNVISIAISESTSFALYTVAGRLVYNERLFETGRAVIDLTKCGAGIFTLKQIVKNSQAKYFKVALQ